MERAGSIRKVEIHDQSLHLALTHKTKGAENSIGKKTGRGGGEMDHRLRTTKGKNGAHR